MLLSMPRYGTTSPLPPPTLSPLPPSTDNTDITTTANTDTIATARITGPLHHPHMQSHHHGLRHWTHDYPIIYMIITLMQHRCQNNTIAAITTSALLPPSNYKCFQILIVLYCIRCIV